MSATMVKKVNPLVGRTAELHEYATSDLSVEEQLAGGASVDDLIQAGVLYDDDDERCTFTPKPTEEEMAAVREQASKAPPMTDAEFQEFMSNFFGPARPRSGRAVTRGKGGSA